MLDRIKGFVIQDFLMKSCEVYQLSTIVLTSVVWRSTSRDIQTDIGIKNG